MAGMLAVLLPSCTLRCGSSKEQGVGKPVVCWIEGSANFGRTKTREDIGALLDTLKAHGFNGVILDVKRVHGDVFYESGIYPPCIANRTDTLRDRGFDYLQTFIDQTRKRGMTLTVSVAVFPMGYPAERVGVGYDDPAYDKLFCQEYLPTGMQDIRLSRNPGVFAFLNPVLPEVRGLVMEMVRELVSRYDFDGLVLDYCRFQNIHSDFSETSRLAFEEYAGVRLERFPQDIYEYASDDPQDYRPGPYYGKWLEWRASVVKDYVAGIRSLVKSIKPGMSIEYWAGSWIGSLCQTGQNWAGGQSDWADTLWWGGPGYSRQGFGDQLDVFLLGAYLERIKGADDPLSMEYAIGQARNILPKDRLLFGSFHVHEPDFPSGEAIELCLRKCDGVMVFDLSGILEYGALDKLSEGIARYTLDKER